MQQSLVFTFISDDKPGIVELLSQTVSHAGGNWLESRLTKLAGKFAGFVQVQIDIDKFEPLSQQLQALEKNGIAVLLQKNANAEISPTVNFKLSIIGLDRPGIVKELASAFMGHQLNITEMHSVTESAPMSAEELFKATLSLEKQADMDEERFNDEIESVCNELDLDWNLESL